ncbi:hypothetical protein B0H11DRAFT_1941366 [Mycena galericulata]|nr:hypothetical protein B0H11DRAFT_1941366 [Mycena galericulata]
MRFVHLWTPRCQALEDDEKIFDPEPFKTVFSKYRHARESGRTFENIFAEFKISLRDNEYAINEAGTRLAKAQTEWSLTEFVSTTTSQLSLVNDIRNQDRVDGLQWSEEIDSEDDFEDYDGSTEDFHYEEHDDSTTDSESVHSMSVDSSSTGNDEDDARNRHSDMSPRKCGSVVDGLVEMRQLKPVVYDSSTFRSHLEEYQLSTLQEKFLEICRPGNLLETSHPDVEISFRFYNWRISYGEILSLVGDHRKTTLLSNPMAVYLFLSQSCFKINCETWLLPCLDTLGFQTSGWDLVQVYRDLMRHPVMQDSPDSQVLLSGLDIRLRTVITAQFWAAEHSLINSEDHKTNS